MGFAGRGFHRRTHAENSRERPGPSRAAFRVPARAPRDESPDKRREVRQIDRARAYACLADSDLVKPKGFDNFSALIQAVGASWGEINGPAPLVYSPESAV